MKRIPSGWPLPWWQNYLDTCRMAHESSEDQSERIDEFRRLLDVALRNGELWATAAHKKLRRDGDSTALRDYAATQGIVSMTVAGQRKRLARSGSARRTRDDGTAGTAQTLFDFMTWDQLAEREREFAKAQVSARADRAIVARLLELQAQVPAAANPHEALKSLGKSMQAWLDEAA